MIKRYSFYIFFAFFFLQVIALQSQLQVQYDANSEPMAGQPYDIDVRASDFNGLFSVQFAVAWDSLVLEVDSLFNVSTSLLDFSRSSLTLPSETMTGTKGRVNLSWFTSAGQSLPDDHLLFTMRFNQVGSECDETEIILTNPENLSIEVIDSNFSDIGASANTVPVMLPGAGCVSSGNDIGLIFSDSTVEAGSSICIPLTVTNFTDVETFQGSFMWDPAVISYSGLQNFGLMGLSAATFNVSMATDGTISFLWFDNTGSTPANIADGGTAFEICFDVVGSDGDMTILKPFDGIVPIQISSPSPVGVREVDLFDGKITIGTEVGPRDLFSIEAENVTVSSMDTEVCVDFSTQNFTDIAGMQYTMQWDPNVLTYNRVETTDSEFASSFAAADNDKLRYVWTHSNGTGLSQADGTVIYSVCFDIVADCDNTTDDSIVSDIAFIAEPSRPIEITDNTFTALADSDVNLVDGSVTISCNAACVETITDVRCFGESNGAINLNIFGGSSPYSVDWDPGATENGVISNTLLVGQSSGIYTAFITDNSGNAFECGPYTISQPDELILTVNVGTTVTTSVSGGNGGETISYSDSNFDPNNPQDGTYTVTATDSRGCTDIQNFTIGDPPCDIAISNITIFSASCIADGRIIVTCTGGSGDYEITSNPQLTFDASGEATAPAGTYVITCTDSNDSACFVSETRTVLSVPVPLVASVTGTMPATCNQANGMISTMISGGCPPFTISVELNGSNNVQPHNDSNKYEAGTYTVRFTDSAGGLVEATAVITSSAGNDIDISNITVDPSPCSGMDGQATFTVTGGCGSTTCQVSINGGAPQACNLVTNNTGTLTGTFPIGNHTITFTDTETGSSDTQPFSIVASPNGLVVTVASAQLPTIDINVSGGAGGYVYQWFYNGNLIATTQDLSGLQDAGAYTVIVQDANGCTVNLEITIFTSGDLGLIVDLVRTPFSGFATPCAEGDCMGVISGIIQAPAPASPPFTITLTDSGANSTEFIFNNDGDFTIDGLCADSYDISLVDNAGGIFSVENSTVITAPPAISIGADPNDLVCPDDGQSNGSILAAVSGGAGNYTLNWSPDALNDPFPTFLVEDLSPGMYTLSVTDDNSCEAEFTFDLLTTCTGAECFQGRRVITPNGDGANEALTIGCSENAQIAIFDRYSRLVFESSNYANNWNGIDMDNIELPQGAYYWVLRTSTNTYKGTVTLLRD